MAQMIDAPHHRVQYCFLEEAYAQRMAAPDFRTLRYFVAVAEECSVGKVARRLNMAQRPLSVHIKNLEAAVGTPSFAGRRAEWKLPMPAMRSSSAQEKRCSLPTKGSTPRVPSGRQQGPAHGRNHGRAFLPGAPLPQERAIRVRLFGWLLEINRLAAFESSGIFLRVSRAL